MNPDLIKDNLGDSVSLVCSAPPETKNLKEFQFYGDWISVSAVASHGNIYIYNMSIMKLKNVGLFRCGYVVHLSGRKVISKKSNPVTVVGPGNLWVCLFIYGIYTLLPINTLRAAWKAGGQY